MDSAGRLLGRKTQLIEGAGPHTILAGYQCYGIKVRVDNTQILSYIKIETDSNATSVVTGDTWQTKNLIANEYIPLEDPIIAITMASAADSAWLHLDNLTV